jgi:hypothetical protein
VHWTENIVHMCAWQRTIADHARSLLPVWCPIPIYYYQITFASCRVINSCRGPPAHAPNMRKSSLTIRILIGPSCVQGANQRRKRHNYEYYVILSLDLRDMRILCNSLHVSSAHDFSHCLDRPCKRP